VPTLCDRPDAWYKAEDRDFLALLGRTPGFWPVDKPAGMTSNTASNAVRRAANARRAGHTGTLDPFATGVLVVALDEALRIVKYSERWDKEYEGTILLGVETDSYDISGKVVRERSAAGVCEDAVRETLGRFIGEIVQKTPPVSAARVRGKRLYERARSGERLAPPRIVTIHSIEVTHVELPRVDVRIRCGRGTYIRSVAHELGDTLGSGAVLESLRRTREGPFTLEHCLNAGLDENVQRST